MDSNENMFSLFPDDRHLRPARNSNGSILDPCTHTAGEYNYYLICSLHFEILTGNEFILIQLLSDLCKAIYGIQCVLISNRITTES